MSNIYAALEIGTTRTMLAIGENGSDGRLKITCEANIPSVGVRKSQIIDINQASRSIKSVINEIEKKQDKSDSSITIGNAFLAVSGQHVKIESFSGTAQVEGNRVNSDEIRQAEDNARRMAIPKDRELLDVVEQDYELDNLSGIIDPKGMAGRVLKLNTLHIHADKNRVQDARTAADAVHLEIREPVFAITAAAEAVLEDHEKKNGVLLIDFGGGSTGYALYCDSYLMTAGVIGVGGDHITNDIAYAFQTTQAQSEEMKLREASALVTAINSENARVKIPGSSPIMESRTISRRALNTVVNARVKELIVIIRDILEDQDLAARMHAGVVITGGGAALRDLPELLQRELGAQVRFGYPINVDGLENVSFPPAYATIAGTLLYAYHNYEEKPIFKNIFGGLFK